MDANGLGQSGEDVFLSPRVVDERAFDDFCTRLRSLIDEAQGHLNGLTDARGEAARHRDALDEASSVARMRLEAAAQIVPRLEDRLTRAEQAIANAVDERALERAVASAVERALASRLEDVKKQTDQIVSDARTRADEFRAAIDQWLTNLEERADTHLRETSETVNGLDRCIDAAEERAGELRAQVTGDLARLDEQTRDIPERLGDARSLIERAERLMSSPDEPDSLASLVARAERAASGCSGASDSASRLAGELERVFSELSPRVEEAAQGATGAREQAESAAKSAKAALADAEKARRKLAGMEKKGDSTLEKLARGLEESGSQAEERVASLESRRAEADALLARLESVREQLDPWRAVMIEGKPDGALPEALQAVVDQVRSELGSELGGVVKALRTFTGGTD